LVIDLKFTLLSKPETLSFSRAMSDLIATYPVNANRMASALNALSYLLLR